MEITQRKAKISIFQKVSQISTDFFVKNCVFLYLKVAILVLCILKSRKTPFSKMQNTNIIQGAFSSSTYFTKRRL